VVLPFLLYLVSTAMSILMLYQAAQPGATVWTKTATNYGILFWSMSSAVNIFASILIIARIQALKNQLTSVMGPEHAKTYTSISAMFVESAALYAIVSVIFVGTFARNNWFQNIVVPVLGQITCIAPLLIILRVAYGRAYTANTLPMTTGIEWGSDARSAASDVDSMENRDVLPAPINVRTRGGILRSGGGTATVTSSKKTTSLSKSSIGDLKA